MYTHLFEYLGEDGAPVTGWHTIDNKRYYFQSDGLRAQNDVVTIDGKKYLFDYDGQLVKNTYGIVERPSMFSLVKQLTTLMLTASFKPVDI